MKNLYQIRCYGKRYEPHEFNNKGWRGWWIRVLNRCRFWLECRVIVNVLVLQAKTIGEDIVDLNSVINTFESDVQTERIHFNQSRPKMAPPTNASVEGHLKEMHRKGSVENPREHTARVLERYAADPRARRYAGARGRRMIMEAESPIPQEIVTDGKKATPQSPARSETPRQTSSRTKYVRPIHPEYAAEAEGELADFDGFVEDDAQTGTDAIERERLSSARQGARAAATAATEHQRSVLSRPATHGSDESDSDRPDRGSDAASQERSSVSRSEAKEHRPSETGPREVRREASSRDEPARDTPGAGNQGDVSSSDTDSTSSEFGGTGNESGSGTPSENGTQSPTGAASPQ